MKSRYWNYKQLEQHLGLSRNTLYSMVRRRAIPFIRISERIVRFDPVEVDAWVESRREVTLEELLSLRGRSRLQINILGEPVS